MSSSRTRSSIDIEARTTKVHVDNRFPIAKYYRTADSLFRQAQIYREENNIVDLYIHLLRFSSLVGETIPEHEGYISFNPKVKAEFRKRLAQVIPELESLKPSVRNEIKKMDSSMPSITSLGPDVAEQYKWPQVSHYQVRRDSGTMQTLQDHLNIMSFSVPPPKVETLSRHSFLNQNNQKSSGWDVPTLQKKVQYPTYLDTSPVEIPRSLKEERNKSGSLAELWSVDQYPAVSDAGTELASQLNLIRQPSPPPVAALVQSLPHVPHSATTVNTIPPWKVADPFPKPVSTVQDGLMQRGGPKTLYISASMMEEFLKLARENTERNLETCGVLAGVLKNASFCVTALIIPKQQSTSDSCQTLNEEEIFDWQDKRNLFQLGWIHTHPKQTCFMSSIDLHTHYSYQVMLPEAIAIVMAPTDTSRTSGIFRLSDPEGIKVIQNCQMRGFHPHEQPDDGSSIYEHCNHVFMSSKLRYEVVDLR